MVEVNRRRLLGHGAALGAAGALTLAAGPAWAAGSSGSLASGTWTTDPNTVWDEPADNLVATLLANDNVTTVNTMLKTWVHNSDPIPTGLPHGVGDFLAQAVQLPRWANRDMLKTAATFNANQGAILDLSYGMGSGMMSCLIPHEAKAVYYSLGGADMKSRIAKTAKYGYDIGSTNAYQPAGDMIVTSVKVRLAHATVRNLLPKSPYWKPSADQTAPISQRDLLITWHSLATFVMRNLQKWGAKYTTDEATAYLHLWQVSAHMLGIQDQFIPATWDDAFAQFDQVVTPILAPTSEGLTLAQILINLADQADGGFASRPMLESATRYVLGDTYANWLAMPTNPVLDPMWKAGWPAYVAFRESTLPLPFAPVGYFTFDEFARQAALFYLGNGQEIDITMPDANRTSF